MYMTEEVNLKGKMIGLDTREEVRNGSILDTGCTKSVAGEMWLKEYMYEV